MIQSVTSPSQACEPFSLPSQNRYRNWGETYNTKQGLLGFEDQVPLLGILEKKDTLNITITNINLPHLNEDRTPSPGRDGDRNVRR